METLRPKMTEMKRCCASTIYERRGSTTYYKIISLAVCDNNDLIAVGSMSPVINTTGFHGRNQFGLDSFEVDLLCMSCGGGAVGTIGPADVPLLIHCSAGRAKDIVNFDFCQIQ